MNILIINGSPKGEESITYQTMEYLKICYPEHSYQTCHAGKFIKKLEKDFSEAADMLKNADLIIFAYPVYTFLVPSQLHRFIELIKENKIDLSGKYATQVSTSKHFYDVTAHTFIEENCADLGMRVIKGLSADMEDLLSKRGQKEARAFFHHVLFEIKHDHGNIKMPGEMKNKRVVVVTDVVAENEKLNSMIQHFVDLMPCNTSVVNIGEFNFFGGCLGCFHCASEGECIYADGFDKFLRNNIQDSDAIVYAFSIKDHSMGYIFKQYDDRQFCNGHRTVTMGKPIGYIVDGKYHEEKNLMMLLEARAEVGGNHLSYVATNESDPDDDISKLVRELIYDLVNEYRQPMNFYGVGGIKIFRDLIYTMQGLMREDHRFYKRHGFYDDFPQKNKGKILAMYAVGQMMKTPSISQKIGGKLTEGMLMPYKKVISDEKKDRNFLL